MSAKPKTRNVASNIAWRNHRMAVCALVVAALGAASTSQAAVPVEESTGVGRSAAPTGSTARLSELYYQLQTLQDEVRELRGLTEEQAHTIARLRKDQKAQYLDLDRRMQGLSAGSSRGGNTSRAGANPAVSNTATNATTTAPSNSGAPELRNGELYIPAAGNSAVGNRAPANRGGNAVAGSAAADSAERVAYGAALEQMKAREFDASIRSFNKLVVDFPGGDYNGNAFYWLGELYLAKGSEAKARQQFVQVIDLYPRHNKVPDALYKIGVIYHRQGDKDRALEFLNRVRGEHAGTNAAKLAADYAKEMQ